MTWTDYLKARLVHDAIGAAIPIALILLTFVGLAVWIAVSEARSSWRCWRIRQAKKKATRAGR